LGHNYSLKRGFSSSSVQLGIEQVIQPLLAFSGDFQSASRGQNSLFERRSSYEQAFKDKKARHILFVHTLSKAIDTRKLQLKEKQNNPKMPPAEKKQLSLFRNLRFKNFLMAVIARCLESIIEEKTDLGKVAFTPNVAKASHKPINNLIELWLPVVTTVLAFVASNIHEELSDVLSQDNILDKIATEVSTSIYTIQTTMPNATLTSFKDCVSPEG